MAGFGTSRTIDLSPLTPPKRTSLLGEGKAEFDPKRSYKELGNRSAICR